MTAFGARGRGTRFERVVAPLALLATIVLVGPAVGDDPFAEWTRDLEKAITQLEAGETKAATRALDALLEEYADLAWPGETSEKNLGRILLYRAIAMQQAGRVEDAHWDMDLAAIFLPEVSGFDLGRFGEGGHSLSEYAVQAARELVALASSTSEVATGAIEREGIVIPPKVVRKEKPRYPTGARRFLGKGKLVVQLIIDESGRVVHARVVEKVNHPVLTYSTLQAFRKWKFEPATLNGKPIRVYYDLTVHFGLR